MNRDRIYGGMVHRGICCAAFLIYGAGGCIKICNEFDIFTGKESECRGISW